MEKLSKTTMENNYYKYRFCDNKKYFETQMFLGLSTFKELTFKIKFFKYLRPQIEIDINLLNLFQLGFQICSYDKSMKLALRIPFIAVFMNGHFHRNTLK